MPKIHICNLVKPPSPFFNLERVVSWCWCLTDEPICLSALRWQCWRAVPLEHLRVLLCCTWGKFGSVPWSSSATTGSQLVPAGTVTAQPVPWLEWFGTWTRSSWTQMRWQHLCWLIWSSLPGVYIDGLVMHRTAGIYESVFSMPWNIYRRNAH